MIEFVRYLVGLDESNTDLIVAADPNFKDRMDKQGEYCKSSLCTHLMEVFIGRPKIKNVVTVKPNLQGRTNTQGE